MPGKKYITDRQWKILLEYMEAHPEFAMGLHPNMTAPTVRHESITRWNELTCRLNGVVSGSKKSEKGWRDYWNQAKYKARTKACTIRKQLKTIMNGTPIRLLVLSKKDKRVLRILGIPLPGFQLVESPPDTTLPDPAPADSSPPDSTPLESSPQLGSSPQPKAKSESEESDGISDTASDLSHSASLLIGKRPPPTKPAWARAIKRKAAYESATSSTRVYSTSYGSTARKRYRPAPPPAAEWVRHIEERRIAVEERSARALQGIQANTEFCASALQGIHIAQERINRTLQGIQSALEASTRALQGSLS